MGDRRGDRRGGWLGRWKQKPVREGVVGVEIRQDGVALVHRLGSAAEPRIAVCEFRPCESRPGAGIDAPAVEALAGAVRDHGLAGTRCVAVLPPHRYGLRLLDAPDVEPDEVAAAVPWLVKDLLDVPLEEAVVDYFQGPDRPGGQSRIHVVTVHRQVVRELSEALAAAGLELTVVDVTELALRNLARRLPEEEQGVAVLRLQARGGVLTMNRGGNLYLARGIETGLDALRAGPPPAPAGHSGIEGTGGPELGGVPVADDYGAGLAGSTALEQEEPDGNEAFDLLALEIQRSLDYYESQLGPSPIAQVALAPAPVPVPGLLPFLEKNLSTGVRRFELDDLGLDAPGADRADQARCLAAVGGALRAAPDDEPRGAG